MPSTTSTVALISKNFFIKKAVIPSICSFSSSNPTTTAKNYLLYSISTARNKYSEKLSSLSCMFSKSTFSSPIPPEFPTPQQIPEQEDPSSFPKEMPEIHTPVPEIDPIPPEKVPDHPPEFSPGPDLPSPDIPRPPVPSPPGPDIPLPPPDTLPPPPFPDIPLQPPDILPTPPDDLPPPRPPGFVPPPSTPPDILPPMGLY